MTAPVPTHLELGRSRSPAAHLLLVRHARQDLVTPGYGDDPPLLAAGIEQARQLAARLKPIGLAAVYSSMLQRAYDTAAEIVRGRPLEVERRVDLNEVDIGSWKDGEFRRRAATDDPVMAEFQRTGRWDTLPVGEGDASLRRRMIASIGEIAARHSGRVVVIVSHSGAINAALADIVGAHRSVVSALDHTSISTVQWTTEGMSVLAVNDNRHLDDPLPRLPPK